MTKVEYRCNQCLIVESKWLVNNVKSAFYLTCSKCGGESKRISSESIYELKGKADSLKFEDHE